MSNKNLPSDFNRIAFKTLLLTTFTAFAAAPLTAQHINDDLRPPTTPAKKKIVKKTKPVVKPPIKRTPTVRQTPVTPVRRPVDLPVAPVDTETPDQIIERFMNFQQSAGVTRANWESVVRQTTAKLQTSPNDATLKAQMFIGVGYLRLAENNFSEALIQFNAAEQILSRSALPNYSLGKVYLATKQATQAERNFERAIDINEDFALAYKGMGEALEAQGKKKKAQSYYEKAASIGLVKTNVAANNPNLTPLPNNQVNPNNNGVTGGNNLNGAPVNQPLPTEYDLELKAARTLTASKKWQTSIDKLMELSKKNPTAEVYIAMGDNYLGMNQLLSAQQAYRQATTANPQSAVAFYKIGSVLFDMNEYQAAADAFEKSLILDQEGKSINRPNARKMADKAKDKADDVKEDSR